MNTVEPIRDKEKITAIKDRLHSQPNPRDYLLFVMGINTALRIGDLLQLRVSDVLNDHGRVREHIYVRTSKTGKELKIKVNKSIQDALNHYFDRIGDFEREDYLFRAERRKTNHPLTKTAAWQLIQAWCKAVDLNEGRYGGHTLRKTWGYQARKAGIDISLIMEKLGHRSPAVTRRYLGITNDEVNDVEMRINL